MSKVLITGGAGFIGAHTARALLERGDDVIIFDNFTDFIYNDTLKEARITEFLKDYQPKVIRGSILDSAAVNAALDEHQPDVIIHLAAHPNANRSMDAPHDYLETNTIGTLNMLEAARHHNVKKFIFAGTSSVYNDEQTPFREDAYPLAPRSPYGASKAAAETYCRMWYDIYRLPVTIVRFFTAYGPWGRPDMAPMIFAEAILTGQPIHLNKDERQRDFTYIDDVVAGVVAAVDADLNFEIINLGRGEPAKLTDLIKALEEAAGEKAVIEERPTPPGEMRITYADTSKAKELLNYQPSTTLEKGANELITWMKDWYLPHKQG